MAFYLYRKFIKNRNKNESPSNSKLDRACEHQRIVSNISDGFVELDDFSRTRRGTTNEVLNNSEGSPKHECQITDGRDGVPQSDECVVCKEKKRAMTKYRWKLMIGLCFPFMVQALDTTLIAGAASFIASDFSKSLDLSIAPFILRPTNLSQTSSHS